MRWDAQYPWLGDCDGVRDLFETNHGELSVGGHCLTFVGTDLEFSACAGFYFQRFGLSGPLESPAGALSARWLDLNANTRPDENTVDLRVGPIVGAPTEDQIFDFYF